MIRAGRAASSTMGMSNQTTATIPAGTVVGSVRRLSNEVAARSGVPRKVDTTVPSSASRIVSSASSTGGAVGFVSTNS